MSLSELLTKSKKAHGDGLPLTLSVGEMGCLVYPDLVGVSGKTRPDLHLLLGGVATETASDRLYSEPFTVHI